MKTTVLFLTDLTLKMTEANEVIEGKVQTVVATAFDAVEAAIAFYGVDRGIQVIKSVRGARLANEIEGLGNKAVADKADDVIKGAGHPKIWDDVIGTADNMPGTEIPATFQIKVDGDFVYKNPTTGDNVLWTNANATEHMGEYISRFGSQSDSIGIRSQAMLESYSSALNSAMNEVASMPAGRHFGTYGGWELGIDTETGVIYHALMK